MKTTFVFVVCIIVFANCNLTLEEIDQDKFGHTLLDTIMLQLKNMDVPDGALTGPPKVIYDMLVELRNSLQDEQDGDQEGLTRMCIECTNTNNEFNDKLEALHEQMKSDVLELSQLTANMEALVAAETAAAGEVSRVQGILDNLETTHSEQLDAQDALIAEARDTHNALAEARAIIADNLVSENALLLLQTSAGVTCRNKLLKIETVYKGFATLALEFMELASNDDIVSDQGMVSELLAAFDELMTQLEDNIAGLQSVRGQMVADYNSLKAPYEDEKRLATSHKSSTTTALRNAQLRVEALQSKADTDASDHAAWAQFIEDEIVRCQSEEVSYNQRIDGRVDQLRVLDAVIELFETRFVELNDYINSQVRMEGDSDIVRHDAENSPEVAP